MSNYKIYPLHPNATHPPIMTCEIPLEEYESLKRENAQLKDEIKRLENVRKVHIESIESMCEGLKLDAKQICRLKRALWIARANDASSFAGLFSTLSYIEDDESRTYWIFGNKRKRVFDGLKCSRMETAYKWFCIWDDVANKCLKKAKECFWMKKEEYK